jgi:transposase
MDALFVGHDWAEDHHDVHLQDGEGRQLAQVRLPDGVAGVARFHALIAEHAQDPAGVVIATETDRGLFVAALVAAGYRVFAVNPASTAAYRTRHSTSGAKSDPGDAKVLADLARTDVHNHRPVAGDSELAEAVKVLARAHQGLVWTRQRQTNQLRSTLREFYPAALEAFDDLASGDALAVLAAAPTPEQGRRLSRSKIAAALRRGGRQRNIDRRTVEIQTALRSEHLEASPLVAEAMGNVVSSLAAVIATMRTQISQLEQQLSEYFETQTARRRLLPVGLLRDHRQPRSTRVLRPTPRRRRHPPPRPARPRQPARGHPPRLPPSPHPLRRTHRLGPQDQPRRLTATTVGYLGAFAG